MQGDDLHKVIDGIYDAVLDESVWTGAMEGVCGLLGGISASLIVHDMGERKPLFFCDCNLDPADWHRYQAHFRQVDLWRDAAEKMVLGEVLLNDQMVDRQAFLRSEWYNDFLKPIDIGQATIGIFQRHAQLLSAVAVYRPGEAERMTAEQCRGLKILLPHLDRAIQVRERLQQAENLRDVGLATLDQLTHCVILATGDGTVLQANRAAAALLRRNDGIRIARGKLVLARQGQTERLRALMAAAARCTIGEAFTSGGAMAVARPSGKRPYTALIARLGTNGRPEGLDACSSPLVAVFISDPEATPEPPADRLQRLFGLTATEAALTAALASGVSPNDYAERVGRSKETIRAHLKSAMAKTDTHSQSALVRLVLSAAATLSAGGPQM